jgi:hypothetical protein
MIMKVFRVSVIIALATAAFCDRDDRLPLTYATIPANVYELPDNSSVVTLLDFVKSRSDLTVLAGILAECGGVYSCIS